jgi:hypothetical protein
MTDIEELKRLAEAANDMASGQWEVWDSCSWRRIGISGRNSETVIEPVVQSDGHPSLKAKREVLDYVACANPSVILSLISRLEKADAALKEIRDSTDVNGRPAGKWHHHCVMIARKALETL